VKVRDLTASVTVSDAVGILKCVAAEPFAMVNFVELVTISKPCMRRGGSLSDSGVTM
jgi:hypothetical protein